MKNLATAVLVALSLLISAGTNFAADDKPSASDIKGTAKTAGESVKADSNTAAAPVKVNVRGKAAETKAASKDKLVDINTATEAELKVVSGIGDAYAAKIIAGRPYASKAQLKSRKIVSPVHYEQIKDQLIARQPQK